MIVFVWQYLYNILGNNPTHAKTKNKKKPIHTCTFSVSLRFFGPFFIALEHFFAVQRNYVNTQEYNFDAVFSSHTQLNC